MHHIGRSVASRTQYLVTQGHFADPGNSLLKIDRTSQRRSHWLLLFFICIASFFPLANQISIDPYSFDRRKQESSYSGGGVGKIGYNKCCNITVIHNHIDPHRRHINQPRSQDPCNIVLNKKTTTDRCGPYLHRHKTNKKDPCPSIAERRGFIHLLLQQHQVRRPAEERSCGVTSGGVEQRLSTNKDQRQHQDRTSAEAETCRVNYERKKTTALNLQGPTSAPSSKIDRSRNHSRTTTEGGRKQQATSRLQRENNISARSGRGSRSAQRPHRNSK